MPPYVFHNPQSAIRIPPRLPLMCPSEHGSFPDFESAKNGLICLYWERLSKSYGRGSFPQNDCGPPRSKGVFSRCEYVSRAKCESQRRESTGKQGNGKLVTRRKP